MLAFNYLSLDHLIMQGASKEEVRSALSSISKIHLLSGSKDAFLTAIAIPHLLQSKAVLCKDTFLGMRFTSQQISLDQCSLNN